MSRRYNRAHARFDQPDPYGGSYDLADPQSLDRYAYAGDDPVNSGDPTGLEEVEVPVCPDGSPCPVDFGGVEVVGYLDPFEGFYGWDGGPAGGGNINPQEPTPRRPMRPEQVAGLATDIADLLKNPQCAEFMARLFMRLEQITGSAPYSINPMAVFNAVRTAPQGGFFIDSSASVSGYTLGNIAPGTATIAFRYISNSPIRAWSNGGVGLHELTHVGTKTGPGYGHTEMAQAAYDVARAMGIKRSNLGQRPANNTARDSNEWKKRDDAAWTHFSNRLFDACSGR